MKRILIIAMLLITSSIESSAQEHIDALLNGNMKNNRYGMTLRSAIKRDPDTGEIIKRVYELTAIDNRPLGKQFIEAFNMDRMTADVWEEIENGKLYDVTAVWTNPKRIYTLSVNGSIVCITVQTIYREEKKSNK